MRRKLWFLVILVLAGLWGCAIEEDVKKEAVDNGFLNMYVSPEFRECANPLWQVLSVFNSPTIKQIESHEFSEVVDDDLINGWNLVLTATREYLKEQGLVLALPESFSRSFLLTSADQQEMTIHQIDLPVYYIREMQEKIAGKIEIIKTVDEGIVITNLYYFKDDRLEKLDQIIFNPDADSVCQTTIDRADFSNYGTESFKLEPAKDFQTVRQALTVGEDTNDCLDCKYWHKKINDLGCLLGSFWICGKLAVSAAAGTAVATKSPHLGALAGFITGGGCIFAVDEVCKLATGNLFDSGYDCTVWLHGQGKNDVCKNDYGLCFPKGNDFMSVCVADCECTKDIGVTTVKKASCAGIDLHLFILAGWTLGKVGMFACELLAGDFFESNTQDCEDWCKKRKEKAMKEGISICGDDICNKFEDCNSCPKDCKCSGSWCLPDKDYGDTDKTCIGIDCNKYYKCVGTGISWCGDGICIPAELGNCEKDCKEKECDYIGNDCGSNHTCVNGKCVIIHCGNGECENELGEDCKSCFIDCGCDSNEVCLNNGICCQPNCDGKKCGSDGCEGSCGECLKDYICKDNQCVQLQLCQPELVGSYDSFINFIDALGIHVASEYAYVIDGDGLKIIDVSNTKTPELIGYYDVSWPAGGIYVLSGYAYVVVHALGLVSGIQILDVSNPKMPKFVGDCDTPGYARNVYVLSGYAYVADNEAGLQIIDISDPKSCKLIGNYNAFDSVNDVYISSGYAYVSAWDLGLQIIDISNPKIPKLIGSCNTPDPALGVYVSSGYAYINGFSGFQIIDVLDPINPELIENYHMSSGAYKVYVSSGYAYAPNGLGFQIIDVSNPEAPKLVGSYNASDSSVMRVYVSSGYVYALGKSSLYIVDVSACLY